MSEELCKEQEEAVEDSHEDLEDAWDDMTEETFDAWMTCDIPHPPATTNENIDRIAWLTIKCEEAQADRREAVEQERRAREKWNDAKKAHADCIHGVELLEKWIKELFFD